MTRLRIRTINNQNQLAKGVDPDACPALSSSRHACYNLSPQSKPREIPRPWTLKGLI